jgi:hypothetical protein
MKFSGNWSGCGEIVNLNVSTNAVSIDNYAINLKIIEQTKNIFILRGSVVGDNKIPNNFNIIGYYNPNTQCIEASEKSGNGVTTTYIRDNHLYHRASVSNGNSKSNTNFAATFKLSKDHCN